MIGRRGRGCEHGGDTQAGEEIRQRGRQAQAQELLPSVGAIKFKEFDQAEVGRDKSTLVAAESEKVQREWIDRLKRDAYIDRFL